MATFVLVHPAWLGGWCWRKFVPLLRLPGHAVHTPTLTGLGERAHLAHPDVDLQVYITDVVNMLAWEDLHQVVLLGNSSAGMVITGVAERVPERIGQLVYLDAFVPEDGQCLLDLVSPDRKAAMQAQVETEGDGWLLPRFAAAPWDQFVPQTWQVTDPVDLAWILERLRPTPFAEPGLAPQPDRPAASPDPEPAQQMEAPVSESYEGRQIVGMDLHRRRSVLVRMTETGERLETVTARSSRSRTCRGLPGVSDPFVEAAEPGPGTKARVYSTSRWPACVTCCVSVRLPGRRRCAASPR